MSQTAFNEGPLRTNPSDCNQMSYMPEYLQSSLQSEAGLLLKDYI